MPTRTRSSVEVFDLTFDHWKTDSPIPWATYASPAALRKILTDRDAAVEAEHANPRTAQGGHAQIEREHNMAARSKVMAWRDDNVARITKRIEASLPQPIRTALDPGFVQMVHSQLVGEDPVQIRALWSSTTDPAMREAIERLTTITKTKGGGLVATQVIPMEEQQRRAREALSLDAEAKLQELESISQGLQLLATTALSGLED